MAKAKIIKKLPPLAFPDTDYAEASSLKAMHAGTATAIQQQIALAWIIKKAAASKAIAFDPDNARLTDYHLGRQFVAHAIVHVIEEPVDSFPKQNPSTMKG